MGSYGLRIIGALQFIDAIGFVLWFALSGAGNTFFPAMVEAVLLGLLSCWVAMWLVYTILLVLMRCGGCFLSILACSLQ